MIDFVELVVLTHSSVDFVELASSVDPIINNNECNSFQCISDRLALEHFYTSVRK